MHRPKKKPQKQSIDKKNQQRITTFKKPNEIRIVSVDMHMIFFGCTKKSTTEIRLILTIRIKLQIVMFVIGEHPKQWWLFSVSFILCWLNDKICTRHKRHRSMFNRLAIVSNAIAFKTNQRQEKKNLNVQHLHYIVFTILLFERVLFFSSPFFCAPAR